MGEGTRARGRHNSYLETWGGKRSSGCKSRWELSKSRKTTRMTKERKWRQHRKVEHDKVSKRGNKVGKRWEASTFRNGCCIGVSFCPSVAHRCWVGYQKRRGKREGRIKTRCKPSRLAFTDMPSRSTAGLKGALN